MMVYVAGPVDRYADEFAAIKVACAVEGYSCHDMSRDYPKLARKYYRGGRLAVVIGNEFPDIEVAYPRRVVVYGFWKFVEHVLQHNLLRC